MEYSSAHRLAQDIRQSEEYLTYHGLKDTVMADETTAALIREYKKLQVTLQMAMMSGQQADSDDMQRFQGITSLLFTTGKLAGKIFDTGAKAHVLQNLGGIQRLLADLVCQLHIFQSRQIADQIIKLEHEAYIMPAVIRQLFFIQGGNFLTIQKHFACAQGIHSSQNIEQRRLARTGRANDNHQFSLLNLK